MHGLGSVPSLGRLGLISWFGYLASCLLFRIYSFVPPQQLLTLEANEIVAKVRSDTTSSP
jgi:hypothetical protein